MFKPTTGQKEKHTYCLSNSAGGTYALAAEGLPYTFDQSIRELDLEKLVSEAKQARELKKQQYLNQSQNP